MNIKNIKINSYLGMSLFLVAGFAIGWMVFHRSPAGEKQETTLTEKKSEIWTCSMHPQIRKEAPGLCPLCAMDLIPVTQEAAQVDPNTISMTEDAARIADVQTTVISMQEAVREVRLYGKIEADERSVQTQPAHLSGRIEELLLSFTGEGVIKGQVIAKIYSPLLITAQQELIEALKLRDTAIISAAREKLMQWKLSGEQIADIQQSGKVKTIFDVVATVSGMVSAKKVNIGDYVQQGSALFEIADLSHVWALFDAYESDLPWIRKGDKISFSLQSMPGKKFSGLIAFIDPVVNPQTRVARLRVEVDNSNNLLKPGMFTTGNVNSSLGSPGKSIVIPQTAVLWTGTRSIVYVKVPDAAEPTFAMREITLGPDMGESYVVLEGLEEGEEIVTNGTFNIDASAQLLGKQSMMNGMANALPTNVLIAKVAASPELQAQLQALLAAYEELKNAFVASDEKRAALAADHLQKKVKSVETSRIGKDQMKFWMDLTRMIETESQRIVKTTDIETQRQSFSVISKEFYTVYKMYGSSQPVYYQFCPMAFDNKGAFWLSETDKILNPYFGDAMLSCGETKEIINN